MTDSPGSDLPFCTLHKRMSRQSKEGGGRNQVKGSAGSEVCSLYRCIRLGTTHRAAVELARAGATSGNLLLLWPLKAFLANKFKQA